MKLEPQPTADFGELQRRSHVVDGPQSRHVTLLKFVPSQAEYRDAWAGTGAPFR